MVDPPAQNQNGSRELNCLIDGKSDVFQVIVAIHKKVGNLREGIKWKRQLSTLKDVDPTTCMVEDNASDRDCTSTWNRRFDWCVLS